MELIPFAILIVLGIIVLLWGLWLDHQEQVADRMRDALYLGTRPMGGFDAYTYSEPDTVTYEPDEPGSKTT